MFWPNYETRLTQPTCVAMSAPRHRFIVLVSRWGSEMLVLWITLTIEPADSDCVRLVPGVTIQLILVGHFLVDEEQLRDSQVTVAITHLSFVDDVVLGYSSSRPLPPVSWRC